MSINGWLYLIQRGDHRKQPKEIYKIGRTNDFNRRINEYPPYTQIISVSPEDDDKKCELELIRQFKDEFELRNDINHEYFEGDEREIISVFNDYVSEHLPNREEDVDMDYHWEIEDQRRTAERNQMRNKKHRY
jgi:predicted metal-dependent peptidase